jgi:hypothetical protein
MAAPRQIIPNNIFAPASAISSTINATIPPAEMNLPFLDQATLNALSNKGKYFELSDFHPDNHLPKASSSMKTQLTFDPDNPSASCFTTHTKKKQIDTLESWIQCFSTFAAYRSFYHPEEAVPLFNYMRHISDKASLYKPEAWLAYDKAFRLDIARYHGQRSWGLPNSYLDAIHFQQKPFLLITTCYECKRRGHSRADCTHAFQTPVHRYQWTPQQPRNPNIYARNPRDSTPPDTELCRDFNRGTCNSPCPFGRMHSCAICQASDHNSINHNQSGGRRPFRNQSGGPPKPFRQANAPNIHRQLTISHDSA